MTPSKKILIFGNPLVEIDSLAVKILPKLKKIFPRIEFVHLDPTENLEFYCPNLKIIDVVLGIKEPKIIKEINKLHLEKINSMHDFDLTYNLKLLEKLGKIKSVEIFGLPPDMNKSAAVKEVKKWLEKMDSSSIF